MSDINEMTRGIQCVTCGVVNWPTAHCCMRCNATLDKRPPRPILSYTPARDMTFSQSLARFFEIVDYVLLVPASYGLLLSLMGLATVPWFTIMIIIWFVAGCYLLRGFFRHSRGRLNSAEVSRLWALTIAYNMVDLIFMWTIAAQDTDSAFYFLGLWPLLVVVFSAMALISENNRNRSVSYY